MILDTPLLSEDGKLTYESENVLKNVNQQLELRD